MNFIMMLIKIIMPNKMRPIIVIQKQGKWNYKLIHKYIIVNMQQFKK